MDDDLTRFERFVEWSGSKHRLIDSMWWNLFIFEGWIRGNIRFAIEMVKLNTIRRDEKIRKYDKFEDCAMVIRRATKVSYRTDEVTGHNVNDPEDVATYSIRHCVDKVTPELLAEREAEFGFTH